PPNWREARHSVLVHGVLLDATGREVRRTQSIPLDRTDSGIRLSLDKAVYEPNEAITLRADGVDGTATVVAMRLRGAPALADWGTWEPDDFVFQKKSKTWQTVPMTEPVVRIL